MLEGAQACVDDRSDMGRKMVELVGFTISDDALSKGGSGQVCRTA